MAVVARGNVHLVRVYVGRDPITKKRLTINRTVHGTLAAAKKVEAKLKGQKESGRAVGGSMMPLDSVFERYSDSVRHMQEESTRNKNIKFYDRYVRPYVGSLPLKRITSRHVQELFNFLLDKKKGSQGRPETGRAWAGRGSALTP